MPTNWLNIGVAVDIAGGGLYPSITVFSLLFYL